MWVVLILILIAFILTQMPEGFRDPPSTMADNEKKVVVEPYDHFVDFDKINEILTMPISAGKPVINNVEPSLTTGTSKFCYPSHYPLLSPQNQCPECPVPFLGRDQPCSTCESKPKKISQTLLDRVVVRQPFFLEGPDLRDYYNCVYYNDFRYPQRPIPLIFAKDPAGYCKKYPYRYPCYVRNSRHDLK